MCGNIDWFSNIKNLNKKIKIGLPDGSSREVKQLRNVRLSSRLILHDVLYIPEFKHNLISVSEVFRNSGLNVLFDTRGCILQDPITDEVVGKGREEDGLYKLELKEEEENEERKKNFVGSEEVNVVDSSNNVSCNEKVDLNLLHVRLGHKSLSKMRHISICNCKQLKSFFCHTCCVAKHDKLPFTSSNAIAKIFLIYYMSICGDHTKSRM